MYCVGPGRSSGESWGEGGQMVSVVDDEDSRLETLIWCQRLSDVKVEVLTFRAVQETMVAIFSPCLPSNLFNVCNLTKV